MPTAKPKHKGAVQPLAQVDANQTARKTRNSTKPEIEEQSRSKKPSEDVSVATEREKSSALSGELRKIHEQLSQMQQEEISNSNNRHPLTKLTSRLVRADILEASDAEIRELAALCLVDVLYLHAPEAPYDDVTLRVIMGLLIEALRGLVKEDSTSAVYVLRRMAICKLGCILVDLPESIPGEEAAGASSLAAALFSTLLDSAAPSLHGQQQLEADSVEVLAGYLEECADGSIPSSVLDILLKHLLPEFRRESHRAYDIARTVVQRCSDKLREPVTRLINGLLLGDYRGLDHMQDAEASTVRGSVYALILELFRVDPNILLLVLPSVESHLQVDDDDLRVKATKLLGEMFLEVRSESVYRDYEKLLIALLQRIADKSLSIRHTVLKFAGRCLASKNIPNELLRLLLEHPIFKEKADSCFLVLALGDSEAPIRSEAVEIASMTLTTINPLHAEAFDFTAPLTLLAKALKSRLHDVSVDIAIRAMEGLSWAYAKQMELLHWVPAAVLGEESKRENRSDYFRIDETRMALIDIAFLENEGSDRVSRFFRLVKAVGSSSRAISNLKRCIFRLRQQVRNAVSDALVQRAQKRVADPAAELLELLRAEKTHWMAIWGLGDNRIFDRLRTLIAPEASRSQMSDARRDLLERIGAGLKSQGMDNDAINKAKVLVKSLVRWTGSWTLTHEEVCSPDFLLHEDVHDDELDIIITFINTFPEIFGKKFTPAIIKTLPSTELSINVLKVLKALARSCTSAMKALPASLSDKFLAIAIKESETSKGSKARKRIDEETNESLKIRKYAAQVLLYMDPSKGEEIRSSVGRCGSWTCGELYVMLPLARMIPDHPMDMALIDFCVEKSKRPFTSASPPVTEIIHKKIALKILIEALLYAVRDPTKITKTDEAKLKSLVLMLRSFVSDMGDPWTGQASRAKGGPSGKPIWPPSEEEHHARIRIICATGLLKLEVIGGRSTLLVEGENEASQLKRQARRFIERARLAFDPVQEYREDFLAKLDKVHLQKGFHMHRNAAILAVITSLHRGPSLNNAWLDLKQLVKALVRSSQESKTSDEIKAIALAPEMILPNLIYILAHHPMFPSDPTEFPAFLKEHERTLTTPIIYFLDALSAAHGKSSARLDSSVSFMLTAIGLIRTKRDVLDDHHGIHCIADLCRAVIRDYVKYSPAALETFRSKIPLPRIYLDIQTGAGRAAGTATPIGFKSPDAAAPSPVSYLPSGFELSLSAVKKRPSRLSGKMTSQKRTKLVQEERSPIRPEPTRKQPRRQARTSQSYVEEPSSDEDDDDVSSETSSE